MSREKWNNSCAALRIMVKPYLWARIPQPWPSVEKADKLIKRITPQRNAKNLLAAPPKPAGPR